MKILNYPIPRCGSRLSPSRRSTRTCSKNAAEMVELMYKSEGLGLAAPQVGLDVQLLVMNFAGDPERKDTEVIALNPVIVEEKGGRISDREGCLSFPGLYQNVVRFKTVVVEYYDLKGDKKQMTCSDLAARVWQHEIDHLERHSVH